MPASIGNFIFRTKTQINERYPPFLFSIGKTRKMGAKLKLSDGISTIQSAGVSVTVDTLESAHITGSIVPQNIIDITQLTLEKNRQILEKL